MSNSKKVFVALLVIVGILVYGCRHQINDAITASPAQAAAEPQATPGLIQEAETAVPDNGALLTDAQATAQAAQSIANDARATANAAVEAANQADVALAAENNRTLSIQATEAADQRRHEERMAELAQQQQAIDNATLALENENLAAYNEQQRLANETLALENDAGRQAGIIVMLALLIVGLVGFAFYATNAWLRQQAEARKLAAAPVRQPTKPLDGPEEEPFDINSAWPAQALPVQVSQSAPGTVAVELDDWSGVATLAQLLAVADGVEAGISLAVANWYGKDSDSNPRPFTRSEIERFIEAITVTGVGPHRRILAYKVNGHAVLKDVGKTYFRQLREKYNA